MLNYNFIKMPPAFTVLGFMYCIIGILVLFNAIKDGYISGLIHEILNILITHKIKLLFILCMIVYCILFVDKFIFNLSNHLYNVKVYTVLDFICSMGEGFFVIGLLIALAIIADNFHLIRYATIYKIAAIAALVAGILNWILKLLINRERPSIGGNYLHFFEYYKTCCSNNASKLLYDYNSMPSGHVIVVSAALTVIFIYVPNIIIRTIIFAVVILMGIARIYTQNHWLSDVLLASIFGVVIGISCVNINNFRINK